MELKVGLKFRKHCGENNVNNIASCEVRGIVDEYIIVLYCKKEATKMSGKKEFYKTIDVTDFEYNVEHNIYREI